MANIGSLEFAAWLHPGQHLGSTKPGKEFAGYRSAAAFPRSIWAPPGRSGEPDSIDQVGPEIGHLALLDFINPFLRLVIVRVPEGSAQLEVLNDGLAFAAVE